MIIPEKARGVVLRELHSTHLSSDGMKRLARGKFHWSGIGKEIERVSKEYESCEENSRSKPNIPGRRNEVIPSSLETGCAGELLSTDFDKYGRINLLIIRHRQSGLLRVYLPADNTMKSAA